MFAWFRRRKRRIYRFHDGRRWRAADPLKALVDLELHEVVVPERDLPAVDAASPEATRNVAEATREIFDVPPFEEGGLGYEELLQVLEGLFAFMEQLKKNTSVAPRQLPPTEESTSSDSTVETTNSGSRSGISSPPPSCDGPTEPARPSKSPSTPSPEPPSPRPGSSQPTPKTPNAADTSTTSIDLGPLQPLPSEAIPTAPKPWPPR